MSESNQPGRRRRSSSIGHIVRRGIPVLVLIGALGGACYYWETASHAPVPHEPPAPLDPVPVETLTVARETVPVTMRFLGQTEGAQVVEIRARVAGYLQERAFEEGSRVEVGQKLFQIDPRPFEVEVAQAEAGLASARATLERATMQLRRFEQLGNQGTVTESEIEEWSTQKQVAAAQVQQRQAEIAAAKLQLDYATITSPIQGVIGQALKDTGSYVDAGQNGLLAVVQQVDPIYVRYAVTEQEILRFRRQVDAHEIVAPDVEQLELEITLSDGSTYPYRGRINFIDIQVDQTTGTSVVRGEVPNPEGLLKPGQFIYTSVLGINRINVIRVPQGVVTQSPTGASVMVVNGGVAELRPVTLGDWSGSDFWIIERGLEPGDQVITSKLMMVRPGLPVSPQGVSSDPTLTDESIPVEDSSRQARLAEENVRATSGPGATAPAPAALPSEGGSDQ